jgi:hypothetical protein
MQVYGLDSIRMELESGGYMVKLLANDHAVIFFPRTTEHRDAGIDGLNYKDDSQGNAIAGMMSHGKIEFRHHNRYSDERVKSIALAILSHPDLACVREFNVLYQGRVLIGSRE